MCVAGRTPMRGTRPDHLEPIAASGAMRALLGAVGGGGRVHARGAVGSSASVCAGLIAQRAERPVVLVVAHLDEADDTTDELNAQFGERTALRFPALETLPGESALSVELFAERAAVVQRLAGEGLGAGRVLVAPIQALMQAAPSMERLERLTLSLRPGDQRSPGDIARWLEQAGYDRLDTVEEPGQFAIRGGILDVFPAGSTGGDGQSSGAPIRLDFFGDEIESITEFDLETMGSDRRIDGVQIVGADPASMAESQGGVSVLEFVSREAVVVMHETLEVVEQGRGYFERVHDPAGVFGPPRVLKLMEERFFASVEINQFSSATRTGTAEVELPVSALPAFSQDAAEAIGELGEIAGARSVTVFCQNEGERTRLGELCAEFAPGARFGVVDAFLHRGFVWDGDDERGGIALVPYHEILNRFMTRRRLRRIRTGRAMDVFVDLEPGDYVVHTDHGVGKFAGLRTMKPRKPSAGAQNEGGAEEYLTLEFAGRAKLHVPVSQIEKVQKYVGGFRGAPKLSAVGSKAWKAQKERTGEAVRDLAAEMLRVQAAREALPGVTYPADTAWQNEFEAEFPYEETEDQLAALAEIKRDMQGGRPMDRLVCGDVGYGKTELAIRAAFKAAEFGKQVAVLAPTTVLAEQHERTFRARFRDYPFRVESVSRFKTRKEQNDTLAAARKGQVDVLIGTHRILSKDVRFADLGLVIIDEEQRFGVEHKQTLLSLRTTVDVLTLSATPIPRTLHMSLLGLRDISSLTTPPLDRRAVVTEVIPFNEKRIRQAISRELSREGQVFYVHNRVHNIRSVADEVQKLAPGARVIVGHGQMAGPELEQVMLRFTRRDADILVCTTIIESGIDIPTANTIIINDADRFGLADLHQLRGRVGRYKHRAYAYLLLPEDRPVTEVARKRLRALEQYSMLGAGFKIAMRDLEIRGAGNLLGAEQSGHIAAVGYDMYCRLLERSVRELRNEPTREAGETVIDLGVTGVLPKGYIPSDARRMEAYRRIARAGDREEIGSIRKDLTDAYGAPPRQVERLFELAEIRVGAHALGVLSISIQDSDVVLRCDDPGPVCAALEGVRGTVRPLPPAKAGEAHEVYFRPPESYLEPGTLLAVLRKRFSGATSGASEGAAAAKS